MSRRHYTSFQQALETAYPFTDPSKLEISIRMQRGKFLGPWSQVLVWWPKSILNASQKEVWVLAWQPLAHVSLSINREIKRETVRRGRGRV